MRAKISSDTRTNHRQRLRISGSKSESNRLMILKALYPSIQIENLSDSDDTRVLSEALKVRSGKVDIHHAGIAMRFLTAYYATKPGTDVLLDGSARMRQRPIALLVNALRDLGANIKYTRQEGYPPLHIEGKKLTGGLVSIGSSTSSQYISALLLIAPSLEDGLEIKLSGEVTSRPYIQMTCSLLSALGACVEVTPKKIRVYPVSKPVETLFTVESDWSSASYFYSLTALSNALSSELCYYAEDSLQGDSALVGIYRALGVATRFKSEGPCVQLSKFRASLPERLELDLKDTPDIAQTIAVTCLGLGISCELTGLHTLAIKETDRLQALKNEIEKLGTAVNIGPDSLRMEHPLPLRPNICIKSYNDHRMAMAFAPLGLLTPIVIDDPGVVSKSFPTFWECLTSLGLTVEFER